jgi:hypothetical protein
MTLGTVVNGRIMGRSVAWRPGSVNAEMIRRGMLERARWRALICGANRFARVFRGLHPSFCVFVSAGLLLNLIVRVLKFGRMF